MTELEKFKKLFDEVEVEYKEVPLESDYLWLYIDPDKKVLGFCEDDTLIFEFKKSDGSFLGITMM